MRTVRARITLTYLLISFATILLSGWITEYQIERYQFGRLVTELNSHLNTVTAILQTRHDARDGVASVSPLLHEISRRADIRITLIDEAGRVLFESLVDDTTLARLENHLDRPEVSQARQEGSGIATRFSTTVQASMAYLARRVDDAGDRGQRLPRVRYVRTAMRMTEVEAMRSRVRVIVFASAVLTLLIVGSVSLFVSRQISRPIEDVSRVIAKVKSGDYSETLRVRSNDEIGRLSAALNEMVVRLNDDAAQLARLETMRSQFLANVSHELRTPLFTMKGFLETLLDGVEDPAVQRRFLEKTEAQADRLDHLLSDLIDISKIESGEMRPRLRFFPIRDLLCEIVEDSSEHAGRKRQNLVVDAPEEPLSVLGDRELLRSAIRNLVDNALKYSPDGTAVTLRARPQGERARITVQDQGPGIAPEHHARIFERFYRVDTNRSRELGGTGLGLAIVKHIIEAHESAIVLESTVGGGSSFSFDLKQST